MTASCVSHVLVMSVPPTLPQMRYVLEHEDVGMEYGKWRSRIVGRLKHMTLAAAASQEASMQDLVVRTKHLESTVTAINDKLEQLCSSSDSKPFFSGDLLRKASAGSSASLRRTPTSSPLRAAPETSDEAKLNAAALPSRTRSGATTPSKIKSLANVEKV